MKIGNLRGIRVPKVLLDQARLGDEIELEVQENKLIVQAVRSPRQGWDEQFAEMARRGEDKARLVRGLGRIGKPYQDAVLAVLHEMFAE